MELQELKQKMAEFLIEKKVEMQKQVKKYQSQNETKLAELEMEKLDVYDVFTTMLDTCMLKVTLNKTINQKEKFQRFCDDYLMQFVIMPKEWRIEYVMAMKNNSKEKIETCKLKLNTAEEIRDRFICFINEK